MIAYQVLKNERGCCRIAQTCKALAALSSDMDDVWTVFLDRRHEKMRTMATTLRRVEHDF